MSKEKTTENTSEEAEDDSDIVEFLNRPLLGQNAAVKALEQENIDHFENEDDDEPAKFGATVLTFHQLQQLQGLFKDRKFFINREVPLESLCFVIRSFSGEVSWDKNYFPGATFDENDESITHQIVDRASISTQYMNRHYIQPQWVFDCVNARRLLPVQNYFIGVKLPSHLSPFVEEKPGDYVPPEKLSMLGLNSNEGEEEDEETEVQNSEEKMEEEEEEKVEPVKPIVRKGKVVKVNKAIQEEKLKNEEKRLKVMMIPKKQKELYKRILKSNKYKNKEVERLKRKREEYEMNQRKQKKSA